MSEQKPTSAEIASCKPVRFDEECACDVCGRFGAFQFDGKALCTDCYELHGSCCPEFGAGDMTGQNERDIKE